LVLISCELFKFAAIIINMKILSVGYPFHNGVPIYGMSAVCL